MGFRHGLGGYQKLCGVTPDLTTLAKSMANSFPIAAVCGKRHLMERYQTGGSMQLFIPPYQPNEQSTRAVSMEQLAIYEAVS
jgi:glutamate-1-semialdehyde aminotransferase